MKINIDKKSLFKLKKLVNKFKEALKTKVFVEKLLKIKNWKGKIEQNRVFKTNLKAAVINNSTSFACTEYSV